MNNRHQGQTDRRSTQVQNDCCDCLSVCFSPAFHVTQQQVLVLTKSNHLEAWTQTSRDETAMAGLDPAVWVGHACVALRKHVLLSQACLPRYLGM